MNIKKSKILSVFFIVFTAFLINIKGVSAVTISLPDYCTNPSSGDDIKNGHLCASGDIVAQCNAALVSVEQEGLPTKCETECEGYYYNFLNTTDSMFTADANEPIYRQMLCNGFEYNGEKLNYLYERNGEIKSVETDSPELYNKVKSDRENNVADSEMGYAESETDKANAQTSMISMPDDDTIEFKDGDIKLDCSSFTALHNVYVMIVILAPVLVILLGSLDYGKAVMASDMDKMQKFKSKFPKRLIALVILIAAPFLVNTILTTLSDKSSSLMYCIVKGNSDSIKLNSSNSSTDASTDQNSDYNQLQSKNPLGLQNACKSACSEIKSSKDAEKCINKCINSYNGKCEKIPESDKKNCYEQHSKEYADKAAKNQ